MVSGNTKVYLSHIPVLTGEGDPPQFSFENLHNLIWSAPHTIKFVIRDRVFPGGILQMWKTKYFLLLRFGIPEGINQLQNDALTCLVLNDFLVFSGKRLIALDMAGMMLNPSTCKKTKLSSSDLLYTDFVIVTSLE